MITVIQRVSAGSVTVDGRIVGSIDRGIVALVAVHKSDTSKDVQWTARKLLELRMFPGPGGNFDLDVAQAGGSILLVSNFTVAADARKGRRPSLDAAAAPEAGNRFFEELVALVRQNMAGAQTGQFGADMQVSLINDGPVTFILDSRSMTAAVQGPS